MPISPAEIGDAFRKLGICRGDVLMLHPDAIVLAQLPKMPVEQCYDILFDQLTEVLGDEGTLVLPTFTYSAVKNEVFDPAETPSAVGALTEHFRKLPGVMRSSDPIFSVAARGRLAGEFAGAGTDDCFGPNSAFGLLAQYDAWLACLGCPFLITFVHFVEQSRGVPYRYFKVFQSKIAEAGHVRAGQSRYYVRDITRATDADLTRLSARMLKSGSMVEVPVGRLLLTAARSGAFSSEALALLDEDINGLILEGKNG